MQPVAALVLAWVIDLPVQAMQPDKCYILAVTRGIRALSDMYTLGPAALGQSGIYISGKALMPMLQLLLVQYMHLGGG